MQCLAKTHNKRRQSDTKPAAVRQFGAVALCDRRQQGNAQVNSTPNLPDQVISQIRAGRKIQAIKLLRESRGMGLKEAKHAVDAYMLASPSPQQPQSSSIGLVLIVSLFLLGYVVYQLLN
jgi:ribosomal protein L7/L12